MPSIVPQELNSVLIKDESNPELTSPNFHKDLVHQTNRSRPQTNNVSVGAHLCCHEQGKQHAVLLQKVQFMTEQINQEKEQARMKEDQYNKIIAALKKTAEENNPKKEQ